MRWFKHISNAAQDEKLALLQAECGLEGYGFFWRVLELIAIQMDGSERNYCHYPEKVWRQFLGLSPKNFRKILGFCSDFEIFTVSEEAGGIRIASSNLLKYRDEWSRKKARFSGEAPVLLLPKEQNTDNRDKEKGKGVEVLGGAHPQWPAFLSCWQVYPVQQGREEAWREWFRLYGRNLLAEPWEIRDGILSMLAEDSRWRRGKAPRMAKWLNGLGWRDKPYVESRQALYPGVEADKQFYQDSPASSGPPGPSGSRVSRNPRGHAPVNYHGPASGKGPACAPTPKTYAQAQDFERRQRAVNLLQEMTGGSHADYCDSTARIEETRGALPEADI